MMWLLESHANLLFLEDIAEIKLAEAYIKAYLVDSIIVKMQAKGTM